MGVKRPLRGLGWGGRPIPGLPAVALGYDWLARVRGLQGPEMWAKIRALPWAVVVRSFGATQTDARHQDWGPYSGRGFALDKAREGVYTYCEVCQGEGPYLARLRRGVAMGRATHLVAGLLALLCPEALRADTLHLADRGRMQGTLRELLFRVDGLPRVYPRADLKGATLSDSGDDAVELADGTRVQGKVISLTMKCADRLYALGRSRIKSVALDAQVEALPAVLEAPVAPAAAEPVPRARELTAEELASQKKGLAKSEDFCKQFLAKAGKRGLLGSASKAEERKKRVLAMAEQIKLELAAGRLFTDGQIYQRYDAALAGKLFREPTKTQLRTMASGVRLIEGPDKNTPELVVEPFPETKY